MTPSDEHVTLGRRLATFLMAGLAGLLIYAAGSKVIKTDKAMKAQQQRAELYLMSDPIAKVACDQTRRITIANLAAEKLFGYAHGEMIGKPIDVLIPQENKTAHDKAIEAARRRLETMQGDWLIRQSVETESLHRDGSRIKTLMDIRSIKYGNPPIIEFVASLISVDAPPSLREVKPLPKLPPPIAPH